MLIVLDFLEKNLKAKELLTSVITLMDVERERERERILLDWHSSSSCVSA